MFAPNRQSPLHSSCTVDGREEEGVGSSFDCSYLELGHVCGGCLQAAGLLIAELLVCGLVAEGESAPPRDSLQRLLWEVFPRDIMGFRMYCVQVSCAGYQLLL